MWPRRIHENCLQRCSVVFTPHIPDVMGVILLTSSVYPSVCMSGCLLPHTPTEGVYASQSYLSPVSLGPHCGQGPRASPWCTMHAWSISALIFLSHGCTNASHGAWQIHGSLFKTNESEITVAPLIFLFQEVALPLADEVQDILCLGKDQ